MHILPQPFLADEVPHPRSYTCLFTKYLLLRSIYYYFFVFHPIFYLRPSLVSPSYNSRNSSLGSSPPSPLGFVPCIFIATRFQLFFPRRLESTSKYIPNRFRSDVEYDRTWYTIFFDRYCRQHIVPPMILWSLR